MFAADGVATKVKRESSSPSPSQRQGTPPNGDAGAGEQEEEGAAETAAAAAVAAEKWVGNQLRARDRVGSWYDSKVVDWRGETGAPRRQDRADLRARDLY